MRIRRAGGHKPEGDARHEHAGEIRDGILEKRCVASRRQPAEADGKEVDHQRGQPEVRRRAEHGRQGGDRSVGGALMSKARQRAEGNREAYGDQECHGRQLEGCRKPFQDVWPDRYGVLEGRAEIALERVPRPFQILHREGPVETMLVLEPLQRLRCGVDAERGARRRAGHDVHGHEEDHRGHEQGRNKGDQPPEDEAKHGDGAPARSGGCPATPGRSAAAGYSSQASFSVLRNPVRIGRKFLSRSVCAVSTHPLATGMTSMVSRDNSCCWR